MRKSIGKAAALMALAAAAMSSEQQRGSVNTAQRGMFLNQKQKRKKWRNAPHTRPSKNKR